MSTMLHLKTILQRDYYRPWGFYDLYREFVSEGGKACHKTVKDNLKKLESMGEISIARKGKKHVSYKALIPVDLTVKSTPTYPQWFCKWFTIIIIGYWAITSLLG